MLILKWTVSFSKNVIPGSGLFLNGIHGTEKVVLVFWFWICCLLTSRFVSALQSLLESNTFENAEEQLGDTCDGFR